MKDLRTLLHPLLKRPEKSNRAIAKLTRTPRRTVDRYRNLVRASGASAEALLAMTNQQLDTLFNRQNPKTVKAQPDVVGALEAMVATGSSIKSQWRHHQAEHGRQAHTYASYWRKVRAYRTTRLPEGQSPRASGLVGVFGTLASHRRKHGPIQAATSKPSALKALANALEADRPWPQDRGYDGYSLGALPVMAWRAGSEGQRPRTPGPRRRDRSQVDGAVW